MDDRGASSSGLPQSGRAPWRRVLDLPNDNVVKTLIVSVSVCLACSVVVSAAAVLLRPFQQANRARERSEHMRAIVAGVPGLAQMVEGLGGLDLEARVVRLETGRYDDSVDALTYDQRAAVQDARQAITVPKDRDTAGLGRVPRLATVYLLREEARLRLLILPVSGQGYASTLYGYVALDGDLNTIRGLTFYEHEETPGLGAQIEDPGWLRQWQGKKVRDEGGRLRVRVATTGGDGGADAVLYEVDAISGATWTSDGVTNLLRFWFGPDGFGPYLQRLEAGG